MLMGILGRELVGRVILVFDLGQSLGCGRIIDRWRSIWGLIWHRGEFGIGLVCLGLGGVENSSSRIKG
jgi:hypothetical protein